MRGAQVPQDRRPREDRETPESGGGSQGAADCPSGRAASGEPPPQPRVGRRRVPRLQLPCLGVAARAD